MDLPRVGSFPQCRFTKGQGGVVERNGLWDEINMTPNPYSNYYQLWNSTQASHFTLLISTPPGITLGLKWNPRVCVSPEHPGVSDAGGLQATLKAAPAQVLSLLEYRQEPNIKNSSPFICLCGDAKCPLLLVTGPDVGRFSAQGK